MVCKCVEFVLVAQSVRHWQEREREGGTVTVFRLSAGNVTGANGLHVCLTLNAITI